MPSNNAVEPFESASSTMTSFLKTHYRVDHPFGGLPGNVSSKGSATERSSLHVVAFLNVNAVTGAALTIKIAYYTEIDQSAYSV